MSPQIPQRSLLGLFILLMLPFTSSLIGQEHERVIKLKDFTRDEVKGVGFILNGDAQIHISSLGGGEKDFWRDWNDDNREPQMFACGWIIDAETRQPVWEMTYDNTRGRSERREFNGEIKLKKGAYEVYFAAPTYFRGSSFSRSSMNIDRRERPGKYRSALSGFLSIFGARDSREMYDEFMELAQDYGITLSVEGDASLQQFDAPLQSKSVVFAAAKLGDQSFVKKLLQVNKDVDVRIYALGEGSDRDEMFDHGWIVHAETRDRIWDMRSQDVVDAGGAEKNILLEGTVHLPKGKYELYYVTDNSHSNDDWNAMPPFDPFNYGISIYVSNESDRSFLKVADLPNIDARAIVNLTRMRDGDFRSAGFTLKADTRLWIYALGEGPDRKRMVDKGWIIDAQTRENAWSMDRSRTYHAGGATKNRLADEIITLPKGNYIAYYETDDSHAYNDWNADPPFDPEHWGLTITGVGEDFDPKSISSYEEGREEGVIAQLVRVRDGRHERQRFTLDKPATVRLYAVGEGEDRTMYDYGWIENVRTGETVWEMTYRMTSHAGGGKKNRLVNTTLLLDKGEYELHYRTDNSHAFNDWNTDPPEDRTHWGITLYREK